MFAFVSCAFGFVFYTITTFKELLCADNDYFIRRLFFNLFRFLSTIGFVTKSTRYFIGYRF